MRAARRQVREVEAAIEDVYLAGSSPATRPSSAAAGRMRPCALLRLLAAHARGRPAARRRCRNTRGRRATSPAPTRPAAASRRHSARMYELVLAQEAGMKAARVGARTVDIEGRRRRWSAGLLKLDLITDASGAGQNMVHARHAATGCAWTSTTSQLSPPPRSGYGVCHRARCTSVRGAGATARHAGEPRVPGEGRSGCASATREWACA